jgi:hypothetical protein
MFVSPPSNTDVLRHPYSVDAQERNENFARFVLWNTSTAFVTLGSSS